MPSTVVAGIARRGAHARSPAAEVVTSSTVPRTVTIPLAKVRVGDEVRLGIKVAVAGGPPRLYLFDTGSTGMFVADDRINPASYAPTVATFNQTYTSGINYQGRVIATTVSLGKGASASGVGLGLIEVATGGEIADWDADLARGRPPYDHRFYGTFGASLTPGTAEKQGDLSNLVAQLPGNLHTGFIIRTGGRDGTHPTLTLGLTARDRAGFHTVALAPAGPVGTTHASSNAGADPVPAWDDKDVPVRYTVARRTSFTSPTIFDTGEPDTTLYTSPGVVPGSLIARRGGLVPGKSFEAALAPRARWRFVTGSRANVNQVQVGAPRADSSVNTGIGLFFREDVMYDIERGQLGFRPIAPPPRGGS